MCEYELEDGHKCPLQRYGNSPFCILHLDFPENKTSIEYSQVIELKNNAIREKIQTGDYNFYGVIIHEFTFPEESIINTSINFNKTKIEGDVSLGRGLTIQGHAFFKGSKIKGNAWFGGSSFKGDIRFDGAQIGGDALFSGISTKGDIWFNDAIINGYTLFLGALIEGNASFERATIEGDACFDGATIKGDACFDGAIIKGDARFCHDKVAGGIIQGDISLIDTKILRKLKFSNSFFNKQHAKEQINRLAKRLCEARGEKFDADKYFFREMVARRKQKSRLETYGKYSKIGRFIKWCEFWLEWPLEYLFFYGVYPAFTFLIWIFIIVIFAVIYGLFSMVDVSSIWGFLYFSITTAMTPGYGGTNPNPGIPQIMASIEAIFGTFMWASFIAILARKFMR